MSLIQDALEKAGQSPLSDSLSTPTESTKAPAHSTVKKQKPTLPLGEDVVPKPPAHHKAVLDEQKKNVKKEKNKKTAGAAVWLFGISVLMIALAACFMLGSEIIHSWQQPKTNREIIQQSTQEVPAAPVAPAATEKTPPATVPDFTLNGITSSGGEQLALINNQIVGVGDRLSEGMVVESIQAKSVILKYHGQKITLRM